MATVCCDYPKYFIIDGVLVFKNHYIHNILIALLCTIYKVITLMRKYYLCDMNWRNIRNEKRSNSCHKQRQHILPAKKY